MISFIHNLFHQPLFVSLLALITCFCFYYLNSKKKDLRKIIWFPYTLIFLLASLIFFGTVFYRAFHPEIWDFTCFYLYGKVAAEGHNFYQPDNFYLVFNSLHLPFTDYEGLVEEVVNVGFPYPPPTMLYFIPLGFLSFKAALLVWTIFNFIFVFGCLYLIYEMFFKTYKLNGLFISSILIFILLPSLSTISASQTNFILLFWLLLMKKYSDKKIGGIFLVLALFTKPYMAIFGLFFLLKMNWKAILYSVISGLVLVGIAVILFGKGVFITYIFDNPLHRLPESVFHESAYQSLYAILIRSNIITPDTSKMYIYISAGVILLTGFYLFYLLKRRLYDYIWAVLLLVGLLIYPGMLFHYGVLLLFVIFQFFDEKKHLGFSPYLSIPIIGVFYYLSTFSIFATICFLFLVIILKSFNVFQRNKLIAIKDS